MAWQNAEENGGWDLTDLWNVDESLANDMLTVLRFLHAEHRYPDGLGFKDEMQRLWKQWRAPRQVEISK